MPRAMGPTVRTRQRSREAAWRPNLKSLGAARGPAPPPGTSPGDCSTGGGALALKRKHAVALRSTPREKSHVHRPRIGDRAHAGRVLSAKTAIAGVVDDGPS